MASWWRTLQVGVEAVGFLPISTNHRRAGKFKLQIDLLRLLRALPLNGFHIHKNVSPFGEIDIFLSHYAGWSLRHPLN